MVFEPSSAPLDRDAFMEWYRQQTEWTESHGYDDPKVSSPGLRAWFLEIIEVYPAMNGPYASEGLDESKITDYSVGREVVYAAFSWSEAEEAFRTAFSLAKKHRVGFFDVSSEQGAVWGPTPDGEFRRVHG